MSRAEERRRNSDSKEHDLLTVKHRQAGLSLRAVTRNTCHGWAQWVSRELQFSVVNVLSVYSLIVTGVHTRVTADSKLNDNPGQVHCIDRGVDKTRGGMNESRLGVSQVHLLLQLTRMCLCCSFSPLRPSSSASFCNLGFPFISHKSTSSKPFLQFIIRSRPAASPCARSSSSLLFRAFSLRFFISSSSVFLALSSASRESSFSSSLEEIRKEKRGQDILI